MQEIIDHTVPTLKEIMKLLFMSNYRSCFNFLNSVPQTSCFRSLFQGFQRLHLLTRSATESLANSGLSGLPAVFPHPAKNDTSRCFTAALISCTAMSAQPVSQQNSSQNPWYAPPRDAPSFFLPLHEYLAS